MISILISFGGEYYEHHGGGKEEQGLAIGEYKLLFLNDLVSSYLFEKANTLLNRTNYHSIYHDDDLVVFNGKKSVQ